MQLDRLQLIGEHSVTSSPGLPSSSETAQEVSEPSQSRYYVSNRILKLQAAIKALTTASSSRVLLHPNTISAALDHILESSSHNSQESSINFPREQELEWLVISKATNQAFGLTLSAILERAVPLSDNIGYWNEVLASNKYIGLYTIQRTPLRLWYLTNDIYIDVWQRIKTIRNAHPGENVLLRPLSDRWRIFYRLVKNSVRDRSLTDTHSAVMSPLTKSRLEARSKRSQLQRLKDTSASGLGILMNECMVFGLEDEEKVFRPEPNSKEEWQSVSYSLSSNSLEKQMRISF